MKNLWLLICAACLWAIAPAISQAEFTGKWKNIGDYQSFDFGKDFKIMHFQEDIDNRQFIILDSNRTLYRIGIDSGNIVKTFKLPDIVDLTDADYLKFGPGDSILVINSNHDEPYKYFCKVIIYNILTPHKVFDTTFSENSTWGHYYDAGSTIVFNSNNPQELYFRNFYTVFYDNSHHTENPKEYYFSYDLKNNAFNKNKHLYYPNFKKSKNNLFFSSYESVNEWNDNVFYNSETYKYKNCFLFKQDSVIIANYLGTYYHKFIGKKIQLASFDTTYTSGYYYINHFPGFTADGKYLIALSDSLIQLFDVNDSTKVIDIPYSNGRNIDIVPIPDKIGNMFYIIEFSDNYLYTRIIKYNYIGRNAIDTAFVKGYFDGNFWLMRINRNNVRMLDSNIMVGGKYWKLDMNLLFSNPKIFVLVDDTIKTTENNFKFSSIISSKYNSIRWNFGDGTSSTELNPVHKYSKAGKYTVTLYVDRGAKIDTLVKKDFVEVFDPPTIKIEFEINTNTEPYTVKIINNSYGKFKENTNIAAEFSGTSFDFTNSKYEIIKLYHSGIYTFSLKYIDAANQERLYSEKLTINLPKAEIIEWEKCKDLDINYMNNSFILNNRIFVNGYNYFNNYNINAKVNLNGELEDVKKDSTEERITYFDKIAENAFCYTNLNSTISKFVLCDSNLTTKREYPFQGISVLKISDDSVYVFAQENFSLNYYKINIANPDSIVEPIKISNSVKSYINYPNSEYIDIFYYTQDSIYRFNFTRYDRNLKEVYSKALKFEAYNPPVQINDNSYLFYQDSVLITIKITKDEIPQIDTTVVGNCYISNVIKQNSQYVMAFVVNYQLNQTNILMIDNLGKIVKTYPLKYNTANFKSALYNSADNSVLLLGYYYATRNLYVAKTKRLDEDLSDVVERENVKSDETIYPNPVEKSMSIKNINQYPSQIIITDMNGKTVPQHYNVESYDNEILRVNVENLLKGAYFIQVNYPNSNQNTYKFIKE